MSARFTASGLLRCSVCAAKESRACSLRWTSVPTASTSQSAFSTSATSHRNTPARRPRDPLESASNATRHAIPTGETFIVRPPPSAPTPFNLANNDANSGAVDSASPLTTLPPALRPHTTSQSNDGQALSTLDIAKVKELRRGNPLKFTASTLAKQFKCSPAFIRIIAPLDRQVRAAKEKPEELKRANWGANKTLHRELRKERKLLW